MAACVIQLKDGSKIQDYSEFEVDGIFAFIFSEGVGTGLKVRAVIKFVGSKLYLFLEEEQICDILCGAKEPLDGALIYNRDAFKDVLEKLENGCIQDVISSALNYKDMLIISTSYESQVDFAVEEFYNKHNGCCFEASAAVDDELFYYATNGNEEKRGTTYTVYFKGMF